MNLFSKLDDYDIIYAIKEWTNSEDFILSKLSNMIINRDLLKIEIQNEPFDKDYILTQKHIAMLSFSITEEEAEYFVFTNSIFNQAYNKQKQNIKIMYKNRSIEDITSASDQYNLEALSNRVTKYFMCYLKS